MKIPTLDLTMSQLSKIYNNPDLMSIIAEIWMTATIGTTEDRGKKELK